MTSTPPNLIPPMKPPEEPAPVREIAGIPVLDSDGEQSSRDGYDGHSAATVAVSPPSRTLGIRGGPCAGTGATSQKTGCTVGTNQTAPMGGSGSGSRKSDARRAQLEASVENAVPSGFGIEDEKKASLHNPESERASPATPGGDPLRVENGGTPAGTFSSHDALDEGNLRGESPDSARVREGSPPQVTAADHLSFSSSYYLAYRDLIQLPEWKLDRPTYEIVKAQVRGDARLSRQERTDLLERLSCPYCGYSDLHHGPSRDCTGRE